MEVGSFGMATVFADGQPCKHPGCSKHATQPCEKCGRVLAQGKFELPREMWTPRKEGNE